MGLTTKSTETYYSAGMDPSDQVQEPIPELTPSSNEKCESAEQPTFGLNHCDELRYKYALDITLKIQSGEPLCKYKMQRGRYKNLPCNRPVVPGTNFCEVCGRKKCALNEDREQISCQRCKFGEDYYIISQGELTGIVMKVIGSTPCVLGYSQDKNTMYRCLTKEQFIACVAHRGFTFDSQCMPKDDDKVSVDISVFQSIYPGISSTCPVFSENHPRANEVREIIKNVKITGGKSCIFRVIGLFSEDERKKCPYLSKYRGRSHLPEKNDDKIPIDKTVNLHTLLL